ncbi:Major facilitator superfamily domain general substrate transporter [Fusarium albosuccineum]|uniref:Major facilitator superfamily domain general substrate transporter n=1 Tax=Fusarium albosuccineum TaxID=1237068 RepID=A0A8H4L1D6_9HYPO|nr:Major facilitator superfamily domain general substrate transporter [Fusarium albosuccineum]
MTLDTRNSLEQKSDKAIVESGPDTRPESETSLNSDEAFVSGGKLALILAALYSTMFLVALDRTIIGTAVPRISSEFHALGDISWYASAYLITSSATQLLWGRIYTFYSTKIIFIAAVVIFEVGSALCGGAPSSTAFIIGRAIAGMGSAGIFSGSSVILTQILPLAKRPMYIGMMGSIFGVASIVGPLMGGALTDNGTWRWCFYINLPIGGAVLAILAAFLHVPRTLKKETLKRQFIRMDPIGTTLFLPGIICLILALQWGGASYPWSDDRIIVLFVVAGVLLVAFIGVQIWRQEDATIPPRIFSQRSIACGVAYAMYIGGGMISLLYTLPIWFQAIKGTSAIQSGIDTIPLVLSLVVGAIMSGAIITRTGYYVPWMFAATILTSVGSGLMTTFKTDTSHSAWIGYQVIFGLGLGTGMQQPSMAAQTVLSQSDVSIGISLMFFAQSLGGAVFVCIGQSLFVNYLSDGLKGISGIDKDAVLEAGATTLTRLIPDNRIHQVLVVYNDALQRAFIVVVAVSCFLVVPALGMEWRSVKNKQQGGGYKE